MRSVRLDQELDRRLRLAADAVGETVSEFLRRAAAERVDVVMGRGQRVDVTDVLGVVRSDSGCARRTGQAFTDALGEDHGAP